MSSNHPIHPKLISPRAAVAVPTLDLARHFRTFLTVVKDVLTRPVQVTPVRVRVLPRSVSDSR